MARQRKQFLLRIPQELYDLYEAWAADAVSYTHLTLPTIYSV